MIYDALIKENVKGSWDYIREEIGLYIYFTFSKEYIQKLKTEYHFYLLENGRLCLVNNLNLK